MANLAKKLKKQYIVYSVKNYTGADNAFIDKEKIIYTNKIKLAKELYIDKYYHFRVHKNNTYIFFGDLDGYSKSIITFIELFQNFLDKYYHLKFKTNEFKYTQNDHNNNSYHYSIPKWHADVDKIREIHSNFIK